MGVSTTFTKGGNSFYVKVRAKGYKAMNVPLGTSDPDEANAKRANIVVEVKRGTWRPPNAVDNMSLDRFLTLYSEAYVRAGGRERREVRERSWKADRWCMDAIIAYLKAQGATSLPKVKSQHAESYREMRLAAEPAPSVETVKRVLRVACAAWNWAIRKGYTTENPFEAMRWPRTSKPDPKNISADDLRKVFDHEYTNSKPEFRAAMATALYAGPRLAEVIALQQSHLVWGPKGLIRLPPGKNGKPRSTVFPPQLQAILEPFKKATGKLFPNVDYWPLVRFVRTVSLSSGVEFSMHDLRRTFAGNMARAGVPSIRLRDYLGHSSVATSEGYYIGRNYDVTEADSTAVRLDLGVATAPNAGPKAGSALSQSVQAV